VGESERRGCSAIDVDMADHPLIVVFVMCCRTTVAIF